MPENYDHYITKNIKTLYRRRLVPPVLYLLLLIVLWHLFSLSELLFPKTLPDNVTIEDAYQEDTFYVHTRLTNLHFTGYNQMRFGITTGYYYYTIQDGECILVLLSPMTCEQGLPTIDQLSVTAQISDGSALYDTLLVNLSEDLHWTAQGIRSQISSLYLNEPGYNLLGNIGLFLVIFITGGYALVCIILFILFIFVPVLSPPCQNLALFGNAKEQLAQAEDELATLPQLATEDMFITEHYFIETSIYGTAIIPINQIIWIYKYSTLHKFFWYHFSISYTLHISANKHLYIQCPKNIKSDIDGIIDYLSEANHEILVGFNEENRLKVQEIQGKPIHFEKLIALLQRRI